MVGAILYFASLATVAGFVIAGMFGHELTNNDLGLMIGGAMNAIILDRILKGG